MKRLAALLLALFTFAGTGTAFASDGDRENGSGDKHQCEGDGACRGRTGDGSFSPTIIIYPPADGLPGFGSQKTESLPELPVPIPALPVPVPDVPVPDLPATPDLPAIPDVPVAAPAEPQSFIPPTPGAILEGIKTIMTTASQFMGDMADICIQMGSLIIKFIQSVFTLTL